MHPAGLHAVLRKRNLLVVRPGKETFPSELGAALSHSTLKPAGAAQLLSKFPVIPSPPCPRQLTHICHGSKILVPQNTHPASLDGQPLQQELLPRIPNPVASLVPNSSELVAPKELNRPELSPVPAFGCTELTELIKWKKHQPPPALSRALPPAHDKATQSKPSLEPV